MNINYYWEHRKDFEYYKSAIEFVQKYSPDGQSILDVGGGSCKYLESVPFQTKHCIDLRNESAADGVVSTVANFMDVILDCQYDVVLCLQVLEHVIDPKKFFHKVLTSGKTAIISVPFKWAKGSCKYHLHDEIDEEIFLGWAGKPAKEMNIVKDSKTSRIIAVF